MSSISQESPDLQAVVISLSGNAVDGLIYIEQLDAGPECSTPRRPYLVAKNDERKTALLFQPACKTWGCPACAEVNKRRWIARAIHGVTVLHEQGHHVDFLTLTSHERLRGAASFRVWPKAWGNLRHRFYRATTPQERLYFAVPERHQDGTLHTHAIITGGLPERWWKDNARQCGLGYMADIQEVIDLGIAGYVGKYLGKTMSDGWPKGKRRVNTTRSWPDLPVVAELGAWTFAKLPSERPLKAEIGDLERNGYDVIVASAAGSWAVLNAINGQE